MSNLAINNIELILLVMAFAVSKARAIPALLILYNVALRVIGEVGDNSQLICSTQADTDILNIGYVTSETFDRCDLNLTLVYLFEGFSIALMAILFLLLVCRMSKVTFFVVAMQSILTLSMAVVVYIVNTTGENLNWVFDIHSSINNKFVIIYVLIAWICVCLSRRRQNG